MKRLSKENNFLDLIRL